MRLKIKHAVLSSALALGIALMPINLASADSGQLRDPTRCGQGNANCRNLPPSASDRIRDKHRAPSRQNERKSGNKPGLMQTSPLPSERLRSPNAPSSTGLDKGSTGITPAPKIRHIGH
jgi:hypothetical protein